MGLKLMIFGLALTLAILSGFGRNRIHRDYDYILLGLRYFIQNIIYMPNQSLFTTII